MSWCLADKLKLLAEYLEMFCTITTSIKQIFFWSRSENTLLVTKNKWNFYSFFAKHFFTFGNNKFISTSCFAFVSLSIFFAIQSLQIYVDYHVILALSFNSHISIFHPLFHYINFFPHSRYMIPLISWIKYSNLLHP